MMILDVVAIIVIIHILSPNMEYSLPTCCSQWEEEEERGERRRRRKDVKYINQCSFPILG
jgi:hypothetical protein